MGSDARVIKLNLCPLSPARSLLSGSSWSLKRGEIVKSSEENLWTLAK